MKKLDKFILKSFLGPFAAILLVVVFILMLQFLWLYIDELVGKGLALRVIMEFLWWGICISLPLALPLATLLSSMMVVGQMAENNELMAIRASGVSLGRVLIPLMLASSAIAVGTFFVGDRLVPKGYNKIFTLRDDIGRTKDEIKIPSGTFYDGIEGYILRVENNDTEAGVMHGVMVYDHTNNKGNTSLTIADSATLKMSKAKDYLIFSLYNGANYKENNVRKYRDTTLELSRIAFDSQELIIPLQNYSFEKSDSSRFGDQIKSMRLDQLKVQKDSLDKSSVTLHDASYERLRLGSQFLQRSQLDTAVKSGATRPFEYDGFMEWDNASSRSFAVTTAKDAAIRMSNLIISESRETQECQYYLRRTNVELYKKFAQALACFILFFIGAPLGALLKKGGLGTSAIVSVLFFVLYWVVDISGNKLARDGAIDAITGTFISAYVLVPIGIFFTWKAVNDSEVFSLDNIKTWWRKFKSKVAGMFHKTRIVYMGTPEFAVEPLDRLIKAGYNVVGVVTVADKPSGRGLKVNESAVKQYAVAHGIPVLQPLKLKDPEFLDALKAWKADMFVVVAFRMLPEEVWSMPRLGTFNLHAALLPQYRGAAPINWAVINGEKLTGVTTFMIDKDIDTGGIILREECRIDPDDTAGDVHDKLMEMGAEAVVQTVEGIIQHNVDVRVQRSFIQGSEVLKHAPKLTRELCHIDWRDTTENIYNLIRGLSPYPTAYTEIASDGPAQQLKIFSARMSDRRGEPGQILTDGRSYLAIATSDGAIDILDLQLQGKKRMDVKSFLLGFRNPETYHALEGTSMAEIAKTRQL